MSNVRFTDFVQSSLEDDAASEWDTFRGDARGYAQGKRKPSMWVGAAYLFTKSCKDAKIALASIKRDRQELTPQRRKLELKVSGTWTRCSKTNLVCPNL